MNPHVLSSFFPPLRLALAVEELAQTILHREKLGVHELPRCRFEVMLQLGYSGFWDDGSATPGEEEAVPVWTTAYTNN